MKPSNHTTKEDAEEFWFGSVWVSIDSDLCGWQFQELDDDESYLSGCLLSDGGVVYDYDGCSELPKEVIWALKSLNVTLDL